MFLPGVGEDFAAKIELFFFHRFSFKIFFSSLLEKPEVVQAASMQRCRQMYVQSGKSLFYLATPGQPLTPASPNGWNRLEVVSCR